MNRSYTRLLCLAAAGGALAGAGFTIAGPLSPPAGPVASTYKTLGEVEPRIAISAVNTPGDAASLYKITAPGSYYLTGDLYGAADKNGIQITVAGVTLDLNGFAVLGTITSLDGVTVSGTRDNIAVVNGAVTGWGGSGVKLGDGQGGRVERIHASANGLYGISINRACTVRDCLVEWNATGIGGYGAAAIEDCVSSDNTGTGIGGDNGWTITRCTALRNHGDGIAASGYSIISDCLSYVNYGNGIAVWGHCAVRGNSCLGNGYLTSDGAGILVQSSYNTVEGNTCIGADRGIDVDAARNVIFRNSCSSNTVNWSLAANNTYGPIIDRSAAATAAVSGNSAADASGSSHPNANFTY
jgi:parallel beta-helix repeat protein